MDDDPMARALLQRAQGLIQKWPEGFQGFHAMVRCRQGIRQAQGRLSLTAGRGGRVDLDADDLRGPVEALVADLAARHTPCFFKDGDGRHPVTFDRSAVAVPGWRVEVAIGPAERRCYQIDPGGRLRQVEWLAGPRLTVTSIAEYRRATPGRLVPTRTTVTVSDARTGSTRVSRIEDRYQRVGDVWLVAVRHLETGGRGEPLEIEILDPSPF